MRYIICFIRFILRNPDLWGNRYWTKKQLARDHTWLKDLLDEVK